MQVIPGVWKTNDVGPASDFYYGINTVAEFLQSVDLTVRADTYAAVKASKVVSAPAIEEKSLLDSVVVVEPEADKVVKKTSKKTGSK